MFEESQYETENSETSIGKIVKDEIQVNNIIAVPENPLEDNQAKDEDLIWIYNLKLQAVRENKNHIIVNTTPLSKSKKSLYAQWNRINLIHNTLYRLWIKSEQNNKCIMQYIVPKHQRVEIPENAHDIKTSGHLGINKTCDKIKDRFYWPSWENEVRKYILSCEIC